MKIKGLKTLKDGRKPIQVTFDGEHPTAGSVFTLDWGELRNAIEKHLNPGDRVLSFRLLENGIDVFHEKVETRQEGMKVHNRITGRKR